MQQQQMLHTLTKISRLGWTKQEEQLLLQLHQGEDIKDWSLIAQKINQISSGKKRSGKQCRERFSNYVRCNGEPINKKAWQTEEETILFQKYMQLGSKWVQISKYIPGRPENCIKNKFYGSLRKTVRNLNRIIKTCLKNKAKQVKYQTIINILQETNDDQQKKLIKVQKNKFNQFVEEIKQLLIGVITSHQQRIEDSKALDLYHKIQEYCKITKSSLLSKIRKCRSLKRKSLPPLFTQKSESNDQRSQGINNGSIYAQQKQQLDQKTFDQQQIRLQKQNSYQGNKQIQLICLINQLTPQIKNRNQLEIRSILGEEEKNQYFSLYGWF